MRRILHEVKIHARNSPLEQIVDILQHKRVRIEENALAIHGQIENVNFRKSHAKLRALQKSKVRWVAAMQLVHEEDVIKNVNELVTST